MYCMTLQSFGCALYFALGYVARLRAEDECRTSRTLRDSIDPPVVKVGYAIVHVLHLLKLEVGAHLAEVPESQRLVLAVRDNVTAIAFGRNVSYAFRVSNKNARRLW